MHSPVFRCLNSQGREITLSVRCIESCLSVLRKVQQDLLVWVHFDPPILQAPVEQNCIFQQKNLFLSRWQHVTCWLCVTVMFYTVWKSLPNKTDKSRALLFIDNRHQIVMKNSSFISCVWVKKTARLSASVMCA